LKAAFAGTGLQPLEPDIRELYKALRAIPANKWKVSKVFIKKIPLLATSQETSKVK